MAYQLVYTKTAVADIHKLDIVAKRSLKKKLELYIQNPFHYAQKLIHSALGSYRWRIGNYRVVFDIQGETIVVLRVDHRREIYKY